MSDRKIVWSISAKFQQLMREAKKADRALEDLEDRHDSLGDAALDSGKKQGQATSIVQQAMKRHAAAVDKSAGSLNAWQKIHQRVEASRKREVEQTESVVRAREAEEKTLSKLYKAQNRHVDAATRAEAVNKKAKATEFEKVRAYDQVRAALTKVDAAQLRYNDTQRRTSVVVDDVTKKVDYSRNAFRRYHTDVKGATKSLHGMGMALKIMLAGPLSGAIVGTVGQLVSAIGSLAAGATALVSALGAAGGILATIPQMALGAGTALGTLVVGFGGLGDVLKASGKAQSALTEKQQKARAEMSASERAAAEYADALAQLPKETQSFAKYLVSLKPKMKQLRATVAKGLMPGAEAGLKSVMSLFPVLEKAMGEMGKVFGDSFKRLGAALAAPKAAGELKRVFASNTRVAGGFTRSLETVTLMLITLMDAARPLTEWLMKGTEAWLKNKAAALDAAKATGKTADFFEKTKTTLKSLGGIFGNLGRAFKNIFAAGYDSGQSLLGTLEVVTDRFANWTEGTEGKNKIKAWFEDSIEPIKAIGNFVRELSNSIFDLSNNESIAPLFDSLTAALPALESLMDTLATQVGDSLGEALKSLIEAYQSFMDNGGAGGMKVFLDTVGLLADGIKRIMEFPNAGTVIGGLAAAFAAFKAMKFVGAITGISSLGRAISGFYRDSKRPPGYIDPAFGPAGSPGGGGAYFPGGGGSGDPKKPAPKKPHWYSRTPSPAGAGGITPVPMGFGATPTSTPKKPGAKPRRFAGMGSRVGGAANKVGGAAGAVWLGSQFLDPESAVGKKAGDLSSVLSAAMFAPMLGGLIPKKDGAVRKGAGKVGGAFRKGGAARTGASKVGGAAKKGVGAVGQGAGKAFGGITKAGKSLSTVLSLLSMNFGHLLSLLGGKLLGAFKAFGGTLKMLGGAFASIGRMLGRGLLSAFSKLGSLLMSFATKVLPMVGKAFMMLGRAMLANPIGLIITAIIALVAAFVYLYRNNEDFRALVQRVWAAIKVAIKAVVDWMVNTAWPWLRGVFQNIGKVVGWLWTNIIKPYFTLIWNIVKTVFQWILNTGWPLLKSAFDKIAAGAKWLWEKGIKPAFGFLRGGVEALVKVFTAVRDQIGRVWSGLVSRISGPISTVIDWINRNFIGKINQLLGKIGVDWRLPTIPGGASVPKDNTSSGGGTSTAGGQWATGGYIPGQSPTATADNIPAWLTAGEFVTRVKSTKRMQRKHPGVLEHINRTGDLPPRYANGGAFGVSPLVAAWYKRVGRAKGFGIDTKPEKRAAGGYVGSATAAHSFAPKFGVGGLISDAWDFFNDAGGYVKGKVSDLLEKLGLTGMLRALSQGVGSKALTGMAEAAKAKMSEIFGEGGGGGGAGIGAGGGHALSRVRALMASSRINGLRVTSTYRSPARNAAVGGIPNSLHMNFANPAVDIGGPTGSLNSFYKILKAVDQWRQLLWQVPGHYDHIHVAAMGGKVPGFARGGKVPGKGKKDSVPAMLTPGEFVLNEGASSSLGSGVLNALNGVQHFHAGGVVNGMKPGASGSWVTGLYRMLMLDRDNSTWGSDLSSRLKMYLGGRQFTPPASAVAPWAARLVQWSKYNRTKSMSSLSQYMDRGTGYMNYQRLMWLAGKRPDAWTAVKKSKKSSSVWLERRYNEEAKQRGDLIYALQAKMGFGKDGTTLDRGLSGADEWSAVRHVLTHGMGMSHDAYLSRPWSPRSAAEMLVVNQRATNAQQAEMYKYLDIFATWGLGDLIEDLQGKDLAEGLPLARSFAGSRTLATDYNKALADSKRLASTATTDALKFISAVMTSSEPLGIRALARTIGAPDFGVVQMYEQLLAAGRLRKGPQTARLDREVPLFRSGLFYAQTGGKVPGTGNSDSVPAMLTPGEFVLRKAAVRALGMGNVKALNNAQYFAGGGPVFPVAPATPTLPASASSAVRRGLSKSAGAGIINIRTNIYNPVRETSTASMHRMLRQQAAQGVFGASMTGATVMVKPEGGST